MHSRPLHWQFILLITSLIILYSWQFLAPEIYHRNPPIWSYTSILLTIFSCILIWKNLKKNQKPSTLPKLQYLSILTIIITTVGTITVIHKLNYSILIDEQYQIAAIQGIIRTGLPYYRSGILYPRSLAYDYIVALISIITNSPINELLSRIPSVIYYIATSILLWKAGNKLFEPKTALIAVLMFTWSLTSIFLGKFARGYLALGFYSLLGSVSYYFVVFKKNTRWTWGFWISIILAPLHLEPGFWLWALIPSFIKTNTKHKLFTAIFWILPILGIISLLLLTSNGFASWTFFIPYLKSRPHWWPSSFYFTYYPWIYPVLTTGFITGILYTIKNYPHKLKLLFLPAITIGLIIIMSLNNTYTRPRYIQWILPLITLISGFGIEKLIRIISNATQISYFSIFKIFIFLLLLLQFKDIVTVWKIDYGSKLPIFRTFNPSQTIYSDHQSIASYVKNNYQQGDLVISAAGLEMMYYVYLPEKTNYYISAFDTSPRTNLKKITNFTDLSKIISSQTNLQKRVWILSDYFTDYHCDSLCRNLEPYLSLKKFLKNNQSKSVYTSRDGYGQAYLFK